MSIQSRVSYLVSGRGKSWTYETSNGNPVGVPAYHPWTCTGGQTTISSDNGLWHARLYILRQIRRAGGDVNKTIFAEILNKLSVMDIGGAFETTRKYYGGPRPFNYNISTNYSLFTTNYSGPLFAVAEHSGITGSTDRYPTPPKVSLDRLIAMGSTAISKTIPTNPVAGLAVFLGELREGLPSLPAYYLLGPGNQKSRLNQAGSDYLNLEFGIKPLISDLRSIATAYKDASRTLDRMEREAGRFIKRRYSFPRETDVKVETFQNRYPVPALNSYLYRGPGTLTKTTTTTRDVWFSGCYSYVFKIDPTLRSKIKAGEQVANKLLGTRITPAVLYELAPWSWAIDWCTNIGDVMTNISAFAADGLVLRWGYLMCTSTVEVQYHLTVNMVAGAPSSLMQTYTSVSKQRIKATPYGFGLDPAKFSPRRAAIVASLIATKDDTRVRRG